MTPKLHNADCLDVLADIDPQTIDSFVDDPPAGISFMGKQWDDCRAYEPRTERGGEVLAGLRLIGLAGWSAGFAAFMFEVAAAKLRVAKPGAHSLSWALPRTSDLTTIALRLAGWEIRDSIVHLFGGGFPKSLDVSKAIDKMHGAEREVVGKHQSPAGNKPGGAALMMGVTGMPADVEITAPATDDARRWSGWGTALSPGAEYWILARAPLDGTVARNVLAHGTGAINVDGCRTPTIGHHSGNNSPGSGRGNAALFGGQNRKGIGGIVSPEHDLGRWPKNALLSCALACERDRHSPGCPVRQLDDMSGVQRTSKATKRPDAVAFSCGTKSTPTRESPSYNGEPDGGASRYFPRFGYHSKASDRTIPGRPDLVNDHPTHKHPDLMRWLVRLVTPPGGLVFDAFMGSGTTGVAAVAEGLRFEGCEADPHNFEIARARILAATGSPEYAAEANEVAPIGTQLGLL